MTPWLKKRTPPKGPPLPGHVDHESLMTDLAARQRMGISTPAQEFLWVAAPAVQMDDWGEPIPLGAMDQDRLDRLVAILAAPYERGMALMHSGEIAPDEVDAIAAVYLDIYALITEKARQDMMSYPPPYPAWAEATLSTVFRRPASAVYAPRAASRNGQPPAGKLRTPEGTQADRRELAVRERR